jgi:hypothetical protein
MGTNALFGARPRGGPPLLVTGEGPYPIDLVEGEYSGKASRNWNTLNNNI